MTGIGVILGTAAYMAPEQAKGKPADKRADIWAFGCVLFEMLTGRQPFADDDVSDTLANVLKRDPGWTALPPGLPVPLTTVLRGCLEKDRRRRIADVAAVLFVLGEMRALATSSGPTAGTAPERVSRMMRIGVPLTTMVAGAALAAALVTSLTSSPVPAETRLDVVTPGVASAADEVTFALSPDGRQIVFRAPSDTGSQMLWLRSLDSDVARPLDGTEGPSGAPLGAPFWSADGQSVGFFTNNLLRRVDLAGGAVRTIRASIQVNTFGASWGEGVILYVPANTSPIFRIAADGTGDVTPATTLGPGHTAHRFPRFLTDGRRFVFFVIGTPSVQGIYLASVDSPETTRLVDTDRMGVFLPPDHLLYGRDQALYAQRVDLERRETAGEPVLISASLAVNPGAFASAALGASVTGTFAYRVAVDEARELLWFDRSGKGTQALAPLPGLGERVSISPDARTLAVTRRIGGANDDIWLIDLARPVPRRLTNDPAVDLGAIFSPDGREAFHSWRKTGGPPNHLYVRSLDRDIDELLYESPGNKNVHDWSADGRFILFTEQAQKTGWDVWALPTAGDRKPFAVLQTEAAETGPRFSPDANWIVYASNESGQTEIFVRGLAGAGRSWQVSTDGATLASAHWSANAREIFYISQDNRMIAVPVTLNTATGTVDVGAAATLFSVPPDTFFDVMPNGRFLINARRPDIVSRPITVVMNWRPPSP
jgi:Tol biopolymer transport system component